METPYSAASIEERDRPKRITGTVETSIATHPSVELNPDIEGNVGYALAHLEGIISSLIDTTQGLDKALLPLYGPEHEIAFATAAPAPANCALAEYILGYANRLTSINMDLATIRERLRL